MYIFVRIMFVMRDSEKSFTRKEKKYSFNIIHVKLISKFVLLSFEVNHITGKCE